MKRQVEELNNSLTERFSSAGPINWAAVPAFEILFSQVSNVGSWLVDYRYRGNEDDALRLLVEAESTILMGNPDFRRRLDRVRELVSHGLRKSRRYEATYRRETLDTRKEG